MKKYIKFLKIDLIICLVLAVLIGIVSLVNSTKGDVEVPRTNKVCTNMERVFDYADVMTDEEENSLRELIAKREPQIQADIVIVTLNEPMTDEEVMVYSDDFQDSEAFGYNEPYGNCAMLVDNWDSSNTYMWFHTAGNIMDKYNNVGTDGVLDHVAEYVNLVPYEAYRVFVEHVYSDMTGDALVDSSPAMLFVVGAALFIIIVFLIVNLSHIGKRKTVNETTYMKDQKYTVHEKKDVFLSKHTTSRTIKTDSGSSGGGGGSSHTSSGGHSYGGGGRHH